MRTLICTKHQEVSFELHLALLASCSVGFRTRVYEKPSDFKASVLRGGFDFALLDLTERGPLTERVLRYLDSIAVRSNGRIALVLNDSQKSSAKGLELFFRLFSFPLQAHEVEYALKMPIACVKSRRGRAGNLHPKLDAAWTA